MAMANLCQLERGSNRFEQKIVDVQICTPIGKSEAADKANVGTVKMAHAISVNKNGTTDSGKSYSKMWGVVGAV
jgi:hypothetical protein